MVVRLLALSSLFACLFGALGCKQTTSPVTRSIRIEPGVVTVAKGATREFTAYVEGGEFPAITWEVAQQNGGTITSSGVYKAPQVPGTYHVIAFVNDEPSVSATATVFVSAGPTVTIAGPRSSSLATPGSTLQFTASVDGVIAGADRVAWSVSPASMGTINSRGLFTAGSVSGQAQITATSLEDPTRKTTVIVKVIQVAKTVFDTNKGTFTLNLRVDKAPNTVANFVSLINKGFYDGIVFHRYEPQFVIQAGDPQTKTLPLDDPAIGTGGPGYTIPFEANDLKHEKYALGMARSQALDSGGSQWYIALTPQPALDGNYVVFGKVEAGFETVDSLRRGDRIIQARIAE